MHKENDVVGRAAARESGPCDWIPDSLLVGLDQSDSLNSFQNYNVVIDVEIFLEHLHIAGVIIIKDSVHTWEGLKSWTLFILQGPA